MKLPLVIVHERERRLAEMLRAPAADARWLMRESRRPDQILNLLARRGPGVLVLQIGLATEKDLGLLQRVSAGAPETGVIAVLDQTIPEVASLAWDLGAHMVFFAPPAADALVQTIAALLRQPTGGLVGEIPLAEPDMEANP
jgi:DNA-binding response OmpR family regulator